MKRIPNLAVALALLLPACDGSGTRVVGQPDAAAVPIGEPVPLTTIDAPSYLPWTDAAPIWGLSEDETSDIAAGVFDLIVGGSRGAYQPVRERCGDVEWTDLQSLISGNPQLEGCLRPYLLERGASEAALDLFFSTGIVVFGVEGDGPVRLAGGADLDLWGSTGSHIEFLFTPMGIVDLADQISFEGTRGWSAMRAALELAHGQTAMETMRAAAGAAGIGEPPISFQNHGEMMYLAPPVRTSYGWSVPLAWRAVGCHACATPMIGRFAVDVSPAGEIAGMRFVDLCYDEDFVPRDEGESALSSSGRYGLVACTFPDRDIG